ncbi:head maturation protease [Acinetobacter phage Ab65]|nr:head maturation protease [Acinetobacter phage Ab65]
MAALVKTHKTPAVAMDSAPKAGKLSETTLKALRGLK